jgi:hypothetical protein
MIIDEGKLKYLEQLKSSNDRIIIDAGKPRYLTRINPIYRPKPHIHHPGIKP